MLLGNGDGTFQTAVTYGSGGYSATFGRGSGRERGRQARPAGGELCADSNCGTARTACVGVLLGNGDGTFQTAVTYGSGGIEAFSVAVADVNGDGKPDLLVANVVQQQQL